MTPGPSGLSLLQVLVELLLMGMGQMNPAPTSLITAETPAVINQSVGQTHVILMDRTSVSSKHLELQLQCGSKLQRMR